MSGDHAHGVVAAVVTALRRTTLRVFLGQCRWVRNCAPRRRLKRRRNQNAAKVLRTMPRNVAATIQAKIKVLANDPYSATNVKKLTGRDGYRLRVGDWRVLFEINDGKLVILVLAVRPRGGAYE